MEEQNIPEEYKPILCGDISVMNYYLAYQL